MLRNSSFVIGHSSFVIRNYRADSSPQSPACSSHACESGSETNVQLPTLNVQMLKRRNGTQIRSRGTTVGIRSAHRSPRRTIAQPPRRQSCRRPIASVWNLPASQPRRSPGRGITQCAAANPAGASRLQSSPPLRRVADISSKGSEASFELPDKLWKRSIASSPSSQSLILYSPVRNFIWQFGTLFSAHNVVTK